MLLLLQAVSFVESRLYNAFQNNCIQNTDFLVRVMTGGAVRNAPLIFDALCGHVPPQDNPMLLMFMLMTRMSWCVSSSPLLAIPSMHKICFLWCLANARYKECILAKPGRVPVQTTKQVGAREENGFVPSCRFDVCDGSKVAAAYLESHTCPIISEAGEEEAESVLQHSQKQESMQHTNKVQAAHHTFSYSASSIPA